MTDIRINQSIERIYGTITNPNQWYSILEDMCDEYALRGANIFCWDDTHSELSKTWVTSFLNDLFPQFLESGFLEVEAMMFPSLVGTLPSNNLISNDEWENSTVKESGQSYDLSGGNKWLKENGGIHHRYTASMNVIPGYIDFISFHAGENYLKSQHELKQSINLLLPHMRQALYINRPFSILQERYKAVLEVLDKFKLGVIITDEKLNILMHNVSADAIFCNGDGLTADNNHLTIQESTQRDQLKSSITELQFNPSNTATLPLTRRSQKLPYICHISRIDLSRHSELYPKYLLTLIDPERSEIVNIDGIKTIFQLTQRESDIAQGVIEGKSNQEIAEVQNITLETVKSHVKSLTQKTQCNSRIEVIKLAHSTSIPIDSD